MTILNTDFEMWKAQNKDKSYKDFEFKLNKMSSAGSLLDIPKLNDLSKEAIAKMNSQEVLENVLEWSKKYSKKFYDIISRDLDYSKKVFGLERDNATKIRKDIYKWEDVEDTFRYFFDDIYQKELDEKGYIIDSLCDEKPQITKDIIKKSLDEYIKVYNENDTKDEWFEKMKNVAQSLGFCVNMKEYKKRT